MALVSCKECNHQIYSEASVCPNCGAAHTRKLRFPLMLGVVLLPVIFYWPLAFGRYSRRDRIVGGIYTAISIVAIIINLGSTKNTPTYTPIQADQSVGAYTTPASNSEASNDNPPPSSSDDATASSNAAASDQPAFTTTANELAQAYKSNTVAADDQFKDKEFIIKGVVSDINTDFTGNAVIVLANAENEFHSPQAKLIDPEKSKAAALRKGQSISLICVGAGDIAKKPMLKDCTIKKMGKTIKASLPANQSDDSNHVQVNEDTANEIVDNTASH